MSAPAESQCVVLVVDDDDGVRASTSALLDLIDCAVVTAASGEEAIEVVAKRSPDIIILDIDLPGIDGAETYRRLVAMRGAIRVIFSSGSRNIPRVREFLELSTVRFLEKPYSLDQLTAELEALGVTRNA